MNYVATLTLDYTGQTPNEFQRLFNALCQAGWEYAETSAVVYDAPDLHGVRMALEVLARAIETPGTLSALNLQVQLVAPTRQPPAAQNHKRALEKLLTHELPST